ncbi:hypothetical protein QBZ16_002694 [Prototheca wickerhamii]|uniref:GST N-terminal domain-containing protein n=1 Tax=Prototheca wickerhamii TaxID=3111 RepID=A0AAD9MHS1_PROWI|nr:hypothetical protein QBZ16_002694 [Prototheca wickerhamii]
MTSEKKIILWDNQSCPYAQRAWLTLVEKEIPFETKLVDLKNKSEEFKALYASIHPDPEAPAKVPILEDTDGTKLIESLTVARYLDAKYPERPLMPKSPADVAKIELFLEYFMPAAFGGVFAFLKADTRAAVEELIPGLVKNLKIANTTLERYGSTEGGDYFLGGFYSLADVAASPHIFRMIHGLKGLRGVDYMGLIQEHKLDR